MKKRICIKSGGEEKRKQNRFQGNNSKESLVECANVTTT